MNRQIILGPYAGLTIFQYCCFILTESEFCSFILTESDWLANEVIFSRSFVSLSICWSPFHSLNRHLNRSCEVILGIF